MRLCFVAPASPDLVYTAFIVALSVAFERPGRPEMGNWLTVMNLIGRWGADVFCGWLAGVLGAWLAGGQRCGTRCTALACAASRVCARSALAEAAMFESTLPNAYR